MMREVLKLENISFFYKKENLIINNLNAVFYPGIITALLGINGSGKTTLFKILTGINLPISGNFSYGDIRIDDSNILYYKSLIGFMPEFLQLYKDMRVTDVLILLASLKGCNNFDLESILRTVYLYEHKDKKVKALSKGMKQRLNLAQAIIGQPKIVLFDEPSNGFDCGSILMFYDILKSVAKNGSIVLLSSHHLSEIYNNVDRVLILSSGKILKEIEISKVHIFDEIFYKYIWIYANFNIDVNFLKLLKQKYTDLNIFNENLLHGRVFSKDVVILLSELISFGVNILDLRIEDRILEDTLIRLS